MILQVAFALYPLCLSGAALAFALKAQPGNRSRWLVEIAAGGSVLSFAFLAGAWAFTSYYLRYVSLAFFALAAFRSCLRRQPTGSEPFGRRGGLALSASVLFLFILLNGWIVAAHLRSHQFLDLSFPLAGGSYYVLQGGGSGVTNPFHALGGRMLAVDLVKLDSFGSRAKGVAPRALASYQIFGDTVYGPCAATVVAVRNHLEDNPPGRVDADHPEGNFLVLQCSEGEILMAHLKQGSVLVAAGDKVAPGQPLARVGNSGNTLEPHLHLEARKNGGEAGLAFGGRQLWMNDVVTAPGEPGGCSGASRSDNGR